MAMAGESQPSTSTGLFGFLSFRRGGNQVVSLEPTPQDELDALEQFQSQVSNRISSLLPCNGDGEMMGPLLSLPFLSKLLDSLLETEQEFSALLPVILSRNPSILSKPPSDKLTNDLLDRIIKSLDLCNAVSLSVHAIRHSHRQAHIAASCLLQSDRLGKAQMARARRALQKFLGGITVSSPKESVSRHSGVGSTSFASRDPSFLSSKSLSFAVSKNWSARQQVQAMSAHLMPPRLAAVTDAAGGLAMAVYTMSSFLVFSMWALVSAVPCQDRTGTNGTNTATAPPPPPPPKHLHWAAPMLALQDKITDELKRKDKKNAPTCLLAEMQAMEKSAKWLKEWVEEEEESDDGGPLIEEDRAAEVAIRAAELEETCKVLEDGLGSFERQVREVFHRVVSSRAEVIRCQDHSMRAVSSMHGSSHGHGGLPPMPNGA
ncbi:hypothetical protein LUZ60_007268 [Juncus effusus]|nr:hypothetical protein LUZ60_007268 [Juncus effusus]